MVTTLAAAVARLSSAPEAVTTPAVRCCSRSALSMSEGPPAAGVPASTPCPHAAEAAALTNSPSAQRRETLTCALPSGTTNAGSTELHGGALVHLHRDDLAALHRVPDAELHRGVPRRDVARQHRRRPVRLAVDEDVPGQAHGRD